VEDDGDRYRSIGKLYFDLAEAYKDNNVNAAIILRSKIEKEERHKINEETHPLYSHQKGKVLSYPDKVMELNELYDDLMFDLADASNESMMELKTYSAENIIKFNKRVVAKIKRNNPKNKE